MLENFIFEFAQVMAGRMSYMSKVAGLASIVTMSDATGGGKRPFAKVTSTGKHDYIFPDSHESGVMWFEHLGSSSVPTSAAHLNTMRLEAFFWINTRRIDPIGADIESYATKALAMRCNIAGQSTKARLIRINRKPPEYFNTPELQPYIIPYHIFSIEIELTQVFSCPAEIYATGTERC